MEIGGSQLNAIELASAVQLAGHQVILVSEQGPLAAKANSLGLEHIAIPNSRRRPSLTVVRQLLNIARNRAVDVVHGYEWPPAIEAWIGPGLSRRAVPIATVMSGDVASFLPRRLPLIVGTRQLQRRCIARGFADVTLIEPPVDVSENSPDFVAADYRQGLGVEVNTVLIVVVCRLARELKLEGLISATQAVGQLASQGWPVRLLIVGDGPARREVESAATAANGVARSEVVLLVGELQDPRPAYASADVILGMGGSALRGMAFGKPLIVQGEQGFWRLCDAGSVELFLENGWYGLGTSCDDGVARLRGELIPLLRDPALRLRLGAFSRTLVLDRFSLASAARIQLDSYERALHAGCDPAARDVAMTLLGLATYKLTRRWQRVRGTVAVDDFNSVRHMSAS